MVRLEIWEVQHTHSLKLLPAPLSEVVVAVSVPSMLENYSYLIGPCAKKRLLRNYTEKYKGVQWMWFLNFEA